MSNDKYTPVSEVLKKDTEPTHGNKNIDWSEIDDNQGEVGENEVWEDLPQNDTPSLTNIQEEQKDNEEKWPVNEQETKKTTRSI